VTKIEENLHFLMVFIFTKGSASVLEDKGRILNKEKKIVTK